MYGRQPVPLVPDTPERTERQRSARGEALAQLSNAVVAHIKDFTGRGPDRVRSYWGNDDDAVFVVLRGGRTEMEKSLHAVGAGDSGSGRRALMTALEPLLIETAERATGRRVSSVIIGSSRDQDVSAITFLLEPRSRLS